MKRKLSKLLGIGLTIALVTSLLITAVPAAALTQPQVSVPYGQTTINTVATYTITFTAGTSVPAEGEIVVTFPAGTDLSNFANPGGALYAPGAANVTVDALAGIGGGGMGALVAANTTVSGTVGAPQVLKIKMQNLADGGAVNQTIGQGSLVGVTIQGIVNPATPGDYTLTVATQTVAAVPIEAAATSSTYTITTPSITPLPGVVLAYNSAGVLMSQSNSIQAGVTAALAGGRVEVGPGTYDEDIIVNAPMTIVATGDPGTVIITNANKDAVKFGTITINAAAPVGGTGVTLDGFTFSMTSVVNHPATPVTIGAAATKTTIKNCSITSGTVSAITVAAGSTGNKVMDCTITASGQGALTGVQANGAVAISGTDIAVSTADIGVASGAGTPPAPSSVTSSTITGSSGTGVMVMAGVCNVMNSTFNSLTTALNVTGGTVKASGNTIDGCGSTVVAAPADAIEVSGGTVTMYGNNIKNSASGNYAIGIAGGIFNAYFNNITDNVKNVTSTVAANVTHNWWGSAAGPAVTSIGGTPGVVATKPALGAPAGSGNVAVGATSLLTQTTIGVDVIAINGAGAPVAMGAVAIGKYDSNPEVTSPPILGTGGVLGYYDVFVANTAAASIQVKFYGAVTQYTKVMYAGGLGGQWGTPTNWGVNVAGGYAYVVITTTTNPSINDLGGTPFAVVNDETVAPPSIAAAAGGSPVVGAYDVSITPTFTWSVVPQAIRYEIALSEDPTFTIIEWSYNVNNNFYKADEALRYDTTYYWRVRGVLSEPYQEGGQWITPSTPWTTGIFTTEMEPTEPPQTPIEVNPTKPEVNVEIPPTKITVEPAGAAIPTYMLWIIVVVGAVLIIALIVLIVRTRRVV